MYLSIKSKLINATYHQLADTATDADVNFMIIIISPILISLIVFICDTDYYFGHFLSESVSASALICKLLYISISALYVYLYL